MCHAIEGSIWRDILLAAPALLALGLSLWSILWARHKDRLSAKPWLTSTRVTTVVTDSHPKPGIYLSNDGLGPAIIRSCEITLDGVVRNEDDFLGRWLGALSAAGLRGNDIRFNAIEPPSALGPGKQIALVVVDIPRGGELSDSRTLGLDRLGFEISYESVFRDFAREVLKPGAIARKVSEAMKRNGDYLGLKEKDFEE